MVTEAQPVDAMSDYLAVKEIPTFLQEAFAPTNSSGWDWGDLRNINYFLQYNVDPKVALDVRNNYNGIAKFFRAYFYFEKVKRFGDVPWINKPLDVLILLYFTARVIHVPLLWTRCWLTLTMPVKI